MAGSQMLLGLVIGVAVLIFLVLKTKVHTFLALIISGATIGLIGGMELPKIGGALTGGFGSTLGSIGIVIGFGVMMGRILEVTGAAERMAYTFLRYLGKKNEEWALAFTGYVVSIPIFADSGFVILSPLYKAISKKTGKSVITLSVAMGAGLIVAHHLIPPTPAPLGVAAIYGADLGAVILWGLILALPPMVCGVLYAKWLGKKIYQVPSEDGLDWVREEYDAGKIKVLDVIEDMFPNLDKLPEAWMSFAPVVVPVFLIFLSTVSSAMKITGPFADLASFIGNPVIAVAIGTIIAIYGLAGKESRKDVLARMEEGVQSAGIILLITGAGGALGYVIRQSGIGDYIAKIIIDWPIPVILIPFAIATVIRLIQGSGTVACITSASISAPVLASLNIDPVFATLSAVSGAFCFSYFNDSLFWVVNRMSGITEVKEQLMVWSVPTTIIWFVSAIQLLIVNAIF